MLPIQPFVPVLTLDQQLSSFQDLMDIDIESGRLEDVFRAKRPDSSQHAAHRFHTFGMRQGFRMKLKLIHVPAPPDREIRMLISVSVARSLETLGDTEYQYIGEKIRPKLEALHGSTTHWVRELWTVGAAFYSALRDHTEGHRDLPITVRRLMAVGLLYLINPFDLIPDYIYGDGYVDDAIVLNYCLVEIRRLDPKLLDTYLKRVARAADDTACP